jgi:fructose-specific phosphotransferase system IIA component
MKISDVLSVDTIRLNLHVENKNDLIEQMILLAGKSGNIIDIEEVRNEVFDREKIMTTGVGKGIALPHAKTNAIRSTTAALGILAEAVDYDSLDDKEVNIALLLLGMEGQIGEHLRLLSKISRLMGNEFFRTELLNSKSALDVLNLFKTYEENGINN